MRRLTVSKYRDIINFGGARNAPVALHVRVQRVTTLLKISVLRFEQTNDSDDNENTIIQ